QEQIPWPGLGKPAETEARLDLEMLKGRPLVHALFELQSRLLAKRRQGLLRPAHGLEGERQRKCRKRPQGTDTPVEKLGSMLPADPGHEGQVVILSATAGAAR